MLHDTIMSLVVVAVIIVLACIWYFTSGEEPGDAGILGPRYTDKADPSTIDFVPRPDWYFYFLFYLLRIFKWPESVVLATVGIPTLCLVLLLAIPFIDRSRERRMTRRPVVVIASMLVIASMAVLTWKGATVREAASIDDPQALAEEFAIANNLPDEALPGALVFIESGCLSCHVYLDQGAQSLGAPELTQEGTRNRGVDWQIGHLQDPPAFTPGSQMPPFTAFTDQQYQDLAIFLEASGK
jgi:menaquinol-cytochrome c reductase cytochrome b/c subunit